MRLLPICVSVVMLLWQKIAVIAKAKNTTWPPCTAGLVSHFKFTMLLVYMCLVLFIVLPFKKLKHLQGKTDCTTYSASDLGLCSGYLQIPCELLRHLLLLVPSISTPLHESDKANKAQTHDVNATCTLPRVAI
jgi:hypothetical protein